MKRLPRLLLLLLLALPLIAPSACGSPTQVHEDAPLDVPFWLEVGGFAVFRDGPSVVRFVSVLQDSRCPEGTDVRCVWAGDARLRFTIASAVGDELPFELALTNDTTAVLGELRVTLLALKPPATAEPPAEPSAYLARIVVTAER